MTLPNLMTEDGITRSLRFAKEGHGFSLGDDYRKHLADAGWIDERLNITREGMVELERRSVPA